MIEKLKTEWNKIRPVEEVQVWFGILAFAGGVLWGAVLYKLLH